MSEPFKEKLIKIFEKLKNDKKALIIVVVGLIGMLLVLASEFTSEPIVEPDNEKEFYSYGYDDERGELEKIIGEIHGVGRVSVMLTYEGTAENIYAGNTSEQNANNEVRREEELIILDKGNTEDGLLIKAIYPRVTGVAVVCEGGNSYSVKNEIMQMVKALYNLNSSNISISEMKD